MTDDVESLVDDALADAEFGTEIVSPPGATVDFSPEPVDPAEEPRFAVADLRAFHDGKAMWAANYFVLWPLGLALTVTFEVDAVDEARFCGVARLHEAHDAVVELVESGSTCAGTVAGEYVKLDVREWVYPEGELAETIDQDPKENSEDYGHFLRFARERILAMKPDERRMALGRLVATTIATSDQMMVAS